MRELISHLEDIVARREKGGDMRKAAVRDAFTRADFAEYVLNELRGLSPEQEVQPINLPSGVSNVSFVDDDGDLHTIGLEDDGLVIELDCMQIRRDDHEAIDTLCNILQAFKK